MLVGASNKERAFYGHCENFWCGDGECPSSPAGCGQVCGGSVSSVLRTVAASPEQSTSLAMVPGTGGHTASDLATPLPVLVMGA